MNKKELLLKKLNVFKRMMENDDKEKAIEALTKSQKEEPQIINHNFADRVSNESDNVK